MAALIYAPITPTVSNNMEKAPINYQAGFNSVLKVQQSAAAPVVNNPIGEQIMPANGSLQEHIPPALGLGANKTILEKPLQNAADIGEMFSFPIINVSYALYNKPENFKNRP